MALIRMYQRRGTFEQWNTGVIPTTVILQPGEIGIETDTGRFKIGNGQNVWVELPYYLPDNNPTNDEDRQGKNNHDLYSKLSPLGPQYSQTFTGSQLLVPQSASQVPLIVSGLNGQSALLQRWRSYNDTTLASIDSSGKLVAEGGAYFNNVVDVNNHRITNVAAPSNDNDAVSKLYVDNAIAGLAWKEAVHLIAHGTGNNVALTGNTGTLVIDGHDPLVQADSGVYRILLTAQTTASQNGIYLYTDNGTTYTLTRTTDADSPAELKGSSVYVQEGTTYGTSSWVQSNYTITAFEDQVWVQFSGAALITAGDGMTKDGNRLDVNGTADRITANADSIDIASTYVGQTSITTLGTITTGTWDASVIGATKGGTGLSSYSVGDILYADTTTSLAKLIPGTAGHPLVSGGTGNAPSYSELGTGGIADDAVTYAKIQNVGAQYRVLGRLSSGSGNVEELNPDNLMTIINQGTSDISFNLLPVGTTSTTVAQGDHTHTLDNLSDVVISGTPALRQVLKYDGTKWINELPSGGISIGATPPIDASSGDAWFDSTDGSLYVYYDDGVGGLKTNLIPNPSFEINTDGWYAVYGSIIRDTSEYYVGTASLKIEDLIGLSGTSLAGLMVLPLTDYVFSMWVKGVAGKSVRLSLLEFDSADNFLTQTDSIFNTDGSWQRMSFSKKSESATAEFKLQIRNPSFDPHSFYIDAIQFEEGTVATEYFDGSTNGGTWTGTPHASTSTKPSGIGSAQWVQVKANSALEASILTRMSAVEARSTKIEAANAVRVANQAERDSVYPAPVQGNTVFRADLGYEEKYYAAYNATTNPDGTSGTAGWYRYNGGAPLSYNYLLNSSMDIWQRGTFITNFSVNTYTADRWYVKPALGGIYGVQRLSNLTSNNISPAEGIDNALRFSVNTAGGASVIQIIETLNSEPLTGKTVTASAYVRALDGPNTQGIAIQSSTTVDAGDAATWTTIATASFSVPQSTSWTKMVVTGTVPANAGTVRVVIDMGTLNKSATYDLTGVQLEEGPVDTAFHRNMPNIQAELAACQRYYYRNKATSTGSHLGHGWGTGTTTAMMSVNFPVSMRITPTAIDYSGLQLGNNIDGGLGAVTAAALNTAQSNTDNGMVTITASSLAMRNAYWLQTSSSSGYIGFSAEL